MALAARTRTVTVGTGSTSYTGFGFTPVVLLIFVDKLGSGTDSQGHLSIGITDGSFKSARCILADTSGSNTEKTTASAILHKERIGGAVTTVLDGNVTLDTNGITFNMTTANTNYQLSYLALG